MWKVTRRIRGNERQLEVAHWMNLVTTLWFREQKVDLWYDKTTSGYSLDCYNLQIKQRTISSFCTSELVRLHEEFLELRWGSANKLVNLLAVLEHDESRHRADSDFLCDLWLLVDVDFEEGDIGVLLGEGGEDRRDDPARSTPGSPEVDHDWLIASNERLEVRERLNCCDFAHN